MFSLSDLLDLLTTGNKARIAMEAAIAEGYVENPEAMRQYYQQNRNVLEGWFAYADVEAVLEDLRSGDGSNDLPDLSGQDSTVSYGITGALAGAALAYTLQS